MVFPSAPPSRGPFPVVWRGAGLHSELEKSWTNVHFLSLLYFGAHLEMRWISLFGMLSPFCVSLGEDANTVTINMFRVRALTEKLCLKPCLGLLTMSLVPRRCSTQKGQLICISAAVQCSAVWVEPLVQEVCIWVLGSCCAG